MRAVNEAWEGAETLEAARLDELDRLLAGLSPGALFWTAGYVHARARSAGIVAEAVAPVARQASAAARLTVLFGSQTGNAKRVAEELVARAEAHAIQVRLVRADSYATRELADERALIVVMSTQGDGDPPDDSRAFLRFLSGTRAPKLPQLRFAVIGLGDSSYPQFCVIGQQIDARLAALGGARLAPRADADVDIETVFNPFARTAIDAAKTLLEVPANRGAKVTSLRPAITAVGFTRQRPFAASLLSSQRLTASDSEVRVHHLELDLAGSGLRYAPGDSLGIWPQQDPALVDRILARLHLPGDSSVTHEGVELSFARWLTEKRELTRLSRAALAQIAERASNAPLRALLADPSATLDYLSKHQLLDVLEDFSPVLGAADWVCALPVLQPRLYSIASSSRIVGDEVHLTVAERVDGIGADQRFGVATRQLLNLAEGAKVPIYIEANERFRLPSDGSRDVIMIGPGTGVAPFRAFVQERVALGATGRNWLFFGHRHLRREFLYQTEWLAALSNGGLSRLEVAFSRDQGARVYVQERLREHAQELVTWIDSGAHIYVCGDATRMAKDVHQALIDVIAQARACTVEDAEIELEHLSEQGRYARDVY